MNKYLKTASTNNPVPRTFCQNNRSLHDKNLLLDHVAILNFRFSHRYVHQVFSLSFITSQDFTATEQINISATFNHQRAIRTLLRSSKKHVYNFNEQVN